MEIDDRDLEKRFVVRFKSQLWEMLKKDTQTTMVFSFLTLEISDAQGIGSVILRIAFWGFELYIRYIYNTEAPVLQMIREMNARRSESEAQQKKFDPKDLEENLTKLLGGDAKVRITEIKGEDPKSED